MPLYNLSRKWWCSTLTDKTCTHTQTHRPHTTHTHTELVPFPIELQQGDCISVVWRVDTSGVNGAPCGQAWAGLSSLGGSNAARPQHRSPWLLSHAYRIQRQLLQHTVVSVGHAALFPSHEWQSFNQMYPLVFFFSGFFSGGLNIENSEP